MAKAARREPGQRPASERGQCLCPRRRWQGHWAPRPRGCPGMAMTQTVSEPRVGGCGWGRLHCLPATGWREGPRCSRRGGQSAAAFASGSLPALAFWLTVASCRPRLRAQLGFSSPWSGKNSRAETHRGQEEKLGSQGLLAPGPRDGFRPKGSQAASAAHRVCWGARVKLPRQRVSHSPALGLGQPPPAASSRAPPKTGGKLHVGL